MGVPTDTASGSGVPQSFDTDSNPRIRSLMLSACCSSPTLSSRVESSPQAVGSANAAHTNARRIFPIPSLHVAQTAATHASDTVNCNKLFPCALRHHLAGLPACGERDRAPSIEPAANPWGEGSGRCKTRVGVPVSSRGDLQRRRARSPQLARLASRARLAHPLLLMASESPGHETREDAT